MKIGFDLDGVLYKWTEVVYEYCINLLGYKMSYLEFLDYIQCDKDTIFTYNLIHLRNLYFTRSPEKFVADYMPILAKDNVIYYITNRPSETEIVTSAWLSNYKFPYIENLIFTEDKATIVRRLGIEIFIEDRLSNAIKLKNLTNLVLYLQPWNIARANEFKYTVRSMRDFPLVLEQIKKEF